MTHVHTKTDEPRVGTSLEHQREAATLAMQAKPGFDIATIDEEEFGQGLEKIKLRQVRLQRILDTVLVKDVHYGNPDLGGGRTAFKKPMLYQAGAEELRQFFRLTVRHLDPPVIVQEEKYVSVTATIGIFDNAGRMVAVRTGNCNTLEKRFMRNDGKNFIFADAREMVHNCLAMAEKRASTLGTREATGATGFFSAEEEMDKALASGQTPEQPIEPWTELDKKMVYARAAKIGIGSGEAFAVFAREALGRPDVSFIGARDVETLLKVIEERKQGGRPAAAAPAPAGRTAEDDAADEQLARQ